MSAIYRRRPKTGNSTRPSGPNRVQSALGDGAAAVEGGQPLPSKPGASRESRTATAGEVFLLRSAKMPWGAKLAIDCQAIKLR
jgi:hypothetical protein